MRRTWPLLALLLATTAVVVPSSGGHAEAVRFCADSFRTAQEVTYWVASGDQDINGYLGENVPVVLDELGDHLGIGFTESPTEGAAMITFAWEQPNKSHTDHGDVLATETTVLDSSGNATRSHVRFNPKQIKGMYFTEFYEGSPRAHIRSLLRHELGHSFGLGHVEHGLMAPTVVEYDQDSFSLDVVSAIKEELSCR